MCCYKRHPHVFIVFHVNLKSDFAYGQVVVGVRPTLPVQDMSSLFGIDVAVARL
jgi:hypothetical protein